MPSADIVIKRDDTRPLLYATLADRNGSVNVSGASIKFIVTDSTGGAKTNQSTTAASPRVVISAATCGYVRYSWASTDTDTAGSYRAEWQVTFADGTIATFPNSGHSSLLIVEDLGD